MRRLEKKQMEQLEIEDYCERVRAEDRQMDRILQAAAEAFQQIAQAPPRPDTLYMTPERWQQLQDVQHYHRRRLAQLQRRRRRKKKKGY
jgi:hypothetical protein